jgi:hypothetical protein
MDGKGKRDAAQRIDQRLYVEWLKGGLENLQLQDV